MLTGLLTYAGQLRPGWGPSGSDVVDYVYPYATYLASAWSHGRWPPLWNQDVFLGVPYLANIQAETLYPPNLLLAVLPVLPVLAWLEAIHVCVAGLGMYFFALRAARLGRPGAAVAALVFMIGPYLTGQMAHVDLLDAIAWAPWLMLAVDRNARRPRAWLAATIGALVALIVLGGHPQAAYFSLILGAIAGLGGLWPGLRARQWTHSLRAAGACAGGVCLGAGLAAAQLIPTAELVSQSIRSGGVSPAVAGDSPLFPRGLLGTLLPHYSSQLSPEIPGASLGAAPLALAALALVTRWRSTFVRGWLVVGLVGLWAATGHQGRLYDVLYHLVPGLSLFRVPARLLVFTTVALALLAGLGTRVALVMARARSPGPVLAAAALALVPSLSVGFYELAGSPDPRWLRLFPARPGPPAEDLLLAAAFICAIGGAILVARARPGLRTAVGPALVVLVLADTWLATQPIYSRHPLPAEAYAPTGGARSLLSADPSSRYLTLVATDAGLVPNQNLELGILNGEGYDGGVLPVQRYVAYRQPLLPPGSSNRPDFILAFLTDRIYSVDRLREMGVTSVVAVDGTDPNGGSCPCLVAGDARDGVRVWSVPEAPGRAWLESAGGRQPQVVVSDTGERVEVAVRAEQASLLVLADTDYPGWAAQIDGRPAAIERWNGLLRAVAVPAGEHRVVFTYSPHSVQAGYAVSLLSLLVLTWLLAARPARRLRRSWRA